MGCEARMCESCHEIMHMEHMIWHDTGMYCEECFFEIFVKCDCCEEYYDKNYETFKYCNEEEKNYCEECYEEHIHECLPCASNEIYSLRETIETLENDIVIVETRADIERNRRTAEEDVIKERLKKSIINEISKL